MHHDRDEEVKEVFSDYGNIIEYRRPVNLAKRRPSAFAFIRYDNEQSFIAAQAAMSGRMMWGVELQTGDGDKQDSFFTQDTGTPLTCLHSTHHANTHYYDFSFSAYYYRFYYK